MWMEVQYADNQAKSDYRRLEKEARQAGVRKSWEVITREEQCVSLKKLAVTGSDLIAAGMKPGKEIGNTLNALLELVLENPEKIRNRHFLPAPLQEIRTERSHPKEILQ